LFNTPDKEIYSGTLISDISDHFYSFIIPKINPNSNQQQHKSIVSRNFSLPNLQRFRAELGMTDWVSVLNSQDVDVAYEEFWKIYQDVYNRTFQLKRLRFNKNVNKIQNFMTPGLMVSRLNKKNLHKKSLSVPYAENITKYKNYKSVYQKVLRGAKKLDFTSKLETNAGNPKKTWETLNEILGKSRKTDKIEKININGTPSSNPTEIANHFNNFFTSIGQQISDNVPPVEKKAEDYVNYNRPVPDLLLQNTTPEHVLKTINKFQPKSSCDAQGVSTKMIKFIGEVISIPLSHIFNISLSTGVFP
jgi:hypothetical protein